MIKINKDLKESPRFRHGALAVLDAVLVILAVYVSMELRFEMYIPERHVVSMMRVLPLLVASYMLAFYLGGVYKIMWRFAGVRDLMRLFLVSAIACGFSLACNRFFNLDLFRSVLILTGLFSMLFVGGIRLIWRIFAKDRIAASASDAMPVMRVNPVRTRSISATRIRDGWESRSCWWMMIPPSRD